MLINKLHTSLAHNIPGFSYYYSFGSLQRENGPIVTVYIIHFNSFQTMPFSPSDHEIFTRDITGFSGVGRRRILASACVLPLSSARRVIIYSMGRIFVCSRRKGLFVNREYFNCPRSGKPFTCSPC